MATTRLLVLQPGERTNPAGKPVRNRILLSMPDAEYRSIRPHLEFLILPQHRSLHEPHHKSKSVHFLNEGLISLVVAMMDGKTVEAGIVVIGCTMLSNVLHGGYSWRRTEWIPGLYP